jgi:hypothetical protein
LLPFWTSKGLLELSIVNNFLQKMEQCGISSAELSWFRSYLSDRSQETKFHEKCNAINVQLGVPLGPLLFVFILYINDIKNVLRCSKLNLFANDTLLYIAADTLDEAVNRINDNLVSFSQWLALNKLKLNVSKTKYMVINFKKNVPVDLFKVKIGDNDLELCSNLQELYNGQIV